MQSLHGSADQEGPQYIFRDPGFGFFEARDSGFWKKWGARFGIVI